jgi:probable rRNA maturation factor
MEPRSSLAPGFGGDLIITDRLWRVHVPNLESRVKRAMHVTQCGASVVLTDDRTIQRLNYRDRGKNKPTNVLTYEAPPEILLAFGTVRQEARAANKSVAAHLTHLLIHGALHLAGHDHHHAGDARRMESTEARLLAKLRVSNPWKHGRGV